MSPRTVFFIICITTYFATAQNFAWCQSYQGLITDNYAGVHAMHVQPASISSTPYKWDFNILSANLEGYNAEFFTNFEIANRLNEIGKGSFFEGLSDGEQDYLIQVRVLFPSVVYTIDDKSAVGFSMRARANTTINTNNTELIDLLKDDFQDAANFGKTYVGGDIAGNFNTWMEYSFNYARQLYDDDKHKVRVGVTPKLLSGTGSGYLSIEGLGFTVEDATRLANVNGRVGLGYSSSVDEVLNGRLNLLRNISFGLNLGVEYEFRGAEYQPVTGNSFDPGYDWKIGLAYLDYGNLKFELKNANSQFIADVASLEIDSFRELESVQALRDTLAAILEESVGRDSYKVRLPATFAFQVDRRIHQNIYANFSGYLSLGARNTFTLTRPNTYILTLRYQKRKWGIQVPLSSNSVSGGRVGIAARYGIVALGSSDLLSSALSSNSKKINLFLSVKFRIWKNAFRKRKES